MEKITPYDMSYFSDREVVQAIINQCFIVDYGIVKAVNSDKTVDVLHCVKNVLINGLELPEIITRNVEVLWPSGSGLTISGVLASGDGVLLLGLRGVVPSTEGLASAQIPPAFHHYSQETLKAIPFSFPRADSNSEITQTSEGLLLKSAGKVTLDTINGSLFGQVADICDELSESLTQLITALTAIVAVVPSVSAQATQLGLIKVRVDATKALIQGGSN